MKTRFVGLWLLLAFTVACGGSAPEQTQPRKMRFAVIPKALDIPVFNYAKIGADRAAAEFGDVEVLWNAPRPNSATSKCCGARQPRRIS